MGPPLFSDGDPGTGQQLHRFHRASMGPPLFSDGDLSPPKPTPRDPPLQWGRRSSATETARVAGCRCNDWRFNGAAALQRRRPSRNAASTCSAVWLQWGRRSSATETLRPTPNPPTLSEASMGPPLFSDGDQPSFIAVGDGSDLLQWGRRSSATETKAFASKLCRICGGFNGAAALQRRRLLKHRNHQQKPHGLQWGRRSSATETASTRQQEKPQWSLQWGRRSSATETSLDVLRYSPPGSLQWGRRSSATETPPNTQAIFHERFASMGPPLFSDGDKLAAVNVGTTQKRFNGAAALQRRRQA